MNNRRKHNRQIYILYIYNKEYYTTSLARDRHHSIIIKFSIKWNVLWDGSFAIRNLRENWESSVQISFKKKKKKMMKIQKRLTN